MISYNPLTKNDKKWFDNYFGVTQKKRDQRWILTFNKEVICSNIHYPTCVAKKNQMIKSGNYTKQEYLFKIIKFIK